MTSQFLPTCLLWTIGVLLLSLSKPVPGRAQQNAFQAANKQFTQADGQLDYLAPLRILQANKAQFEPDTYAQASATYYSFIGKNSVPAPTAPLGNHRLLPIAPHLLARARTASVVLLNEAHDFPAHRHYCRQLLTQLAPLGYRLFAVEALTPEATGLNERKFPLAASGFYTCEPTMGKLLRAATEAGYYVVGHEVRETQEKEFTDWKQRSNYRDSMQAVNMLAVLRAHPGAKLVALVGYDHVQEKEQEGLKRLATYLRELGHLDPLTIDQTTEYSASNATEPQLLATSTGTPTVTGRYSQLVDLQVIHPKLTYVQGRPRWLVTGQPVTALIPTAYRGHVCLAQLYDQAEFAQYGAKAIPLDQYLTTATQQQVILYPYKANRKTHVVYHLADGLYPVAGKQQ